MLITKKIWVLFLAVGVLAALPALAGYHSESGYLADIYDSNSFTLYANSTAIDLDFAYPSGADFWVTVYGMYGDQLGDFQLSQGSTIELTGGGEFTIMVTSEYGGGSWSCSWYDD
ncbi:MAG: hypothetical protein GY771_00585 [bacterium]|nr:hypothetical protein [bacterium]